MWGKMIRFLLTYVFIGGRILISIRDITTYEFQKESVIYEFFKKQKTKWRTKRNLQ